MAHKYSLLLLPLLLLSSCRQKESIQLYCASLSYCEQLIKTSANEYLKKNNLSNVSFICDSYDKDGHTPFYHIPMDFSINTTSNIYSTRCFNLATPFDYKYSKLIDDNVIDGLKESLKFDGKYYGFPISFNVSIMIYNSSIISEKESESYELIVLALKKHNKKMRLGGSEYGIFCFIADLYGYETDWTIAYDYHNFCDILIKDNLNGEIGLKSLKKTIELSREETNDLENKEVINISDELELSNYAVLVDSITTPSLEKIKEVWGKENVKCSILPTIKIDGEAKRINSGINSYSLSLSKQLMASSNYKQNIGYKIIKELTSKEMIKKYYSENDKYSYNFGYPTIKSEDNDELTKIAIEQTKHLRYGGKTIHAANNIALRTLVNKAIAFGDNYTDDDLLRILQEYDDEIHELSGTGTDN